MDNVEENTDLQSVEEKSDEREVVLNISGKRRLIIQVVLAFLALLNTSILSYFTFLVFPSLPFHAIVARLSFSVFLIDTVLVIEGFVFKVVSRLEHIPWKILKELFVSSLKVITMRSFSRFLFPHRTQRFQFRWAR